ncbi:FKBP-type peptidyl-prolyl cis-trans isomerase [Pelobium sp.]|nr:FKBP-type peptidyl-prolyl cis-trans isomerase [Pelobium sp.]MDA9555015.1 FKBP-type peptidyl-prolyl cis-trans isomerase [Pelobium sp.]
MRKILGLLLLVGFTLASCKRETRSLNQIEDEQIQNYIRANNLTGFVKDSTGYYYQVINPGSGDQLKYSSYISIFQKTTSINENVNYEFSKYATFPSYLGYLSPTPWRETLVKLKKGAEVRILIPSYLAFGKNGSGTTIPGNSILDSRITVVNDTDRPAYEDALIQTFLTENKITATKDPSGIYYQIITPGTGNAVTSSTASIKVVYTGRLLTGTVFDQASSSSPLTIALNNTIEGWRIGVPLIKVGGKIRLFIPSRLAYGATGSGLIGANAILDFDIELTDVTN